MRRPNISLMLETSKDCGGYAIKKAGRKYPGSPHKCLRQKGAILC